MEIYRGGSAMQSYGIIGMSKHFVASDQETNRESTSTWG
jgi:hypothetical protein